MKPEEIKKIREEKNLSKADFAKAIGVTAMLLGRYEKGSCAIPEKVAEAALALGAAKAVQKTVEKKVEKAVKATAKKAAGKAAKAAVGVSVAKGVKKRQRNRNPGACPKQEAARKATSCFLSFLTVAV